MKPTRVLHTRPRRTFDVFIYMHKYFEEFCAFQTCSYSHQPLCTSWLSWRARHSSFLTTTRSCFTAPIPPIGRMSISFSRALPAVDSWTSESALSVDSEAQPTHALFQFPELHTIHHASYSSVHNDATDAENQRCR